MYGLKKCVIIVGASKDHYSFYTPCVNFNGATLQKYPRVTDSHVQMIYEMTFRMAMFHFQTSTLQSSAEIITTSKNLSKYSSSTTDI